MPTAGEDDGRSRDPFDRSVDHAGGIHRDETPGTLVRGLFLHPTDFGVRVSLHHLRQSERNRVQALEAQDRGVVQTVFLSVRGEVVVDLAAAQQHLGDVRSLVLGIEQDRLEGAGGEVSLGRHRVLGAQQGLRREDDQWTGESAEDLPAQ